MNEQPLYEQQIASKLEQLPVPDMADAIWLRIKDQLDMDMPADGGSHTPPLPPTRPVRTGKLGFLGIIVATIVLIYFIVPKKQKQTLPSLPEQHQSDTASQIAPPLTSPPGQRRPVTKAVAQSPQRKQDTAQPVPSRQPIQSPVQPDSVVVISPSSLPVQQLLLPLPPVVKDTIPAKKKPRGVRGISDSDYKIVPKTQP